MRRNNHFAYKPRSARTTTVQGVGTARRTCRNKRNQGGCHAAFFSLGKTCQATGIAQPRETTLTTNTVQRCPKLVASSAKANGVPSHRAKTQPNKSAKQVSTASSCRWVPRLASAS